MLQVAQPLNNAFYNMKCGEIFCIPPAVYNVTCCLCATNIHLEQFPSHFLMQHLMLAEECINLAKDVSLLDNMTIKEEDSQDDPLKQEVKQDSCSKLENVQQEQGFTKESECRDLNVGEEVKKEIVLAKPNTRNSRKKSKKSNAVKVKEKFQLEKLNEFNCRETEEASTQEVLAQINIEEQKLKGEYVGDEIGDTIKEKIKVRKQNTRNQRKNNMKKVNSKKSGEKPVIENFQLVKDVKGEEENDLKEEFNSDDADLVRDWSLEDKISDIDSDPDDKNSRKEKPNFPCLNCGRSYTSKNGLLKHNYTFHKMPKPPKIEYKCNECSEVFPSERLLRGHKYKHTGIFCDICGKTFTQSSNMLNHKIRHTGVKAHKCKECDKEFFTSRELKSHMISHTGLPVICEICGKRCRHRGILKAHMRRHTGERPFKCDVCGKCFFSLHDLNVHAVAHTTERPFKCEICGSTFQRRKALRIHKLIHSKDRKHVCKICGKGFAQSGGLNSHMRSHSAALEKTKNEVTQLPALPLQMQAISSQAESTTSSANVEVSMTTDGIIMLGQYMVYK